MQFGEIINKAWRITWRFRYLWVLAVFAGVSGPGGGGGFSFPSGSSGSSSSGNSVSRDFESFFSHADRWIPIVVALLLLWILLAIAWTVVSVAARGGLIWAVDAIEEGYAVRLGQAWKAGFSRFWSMLGLSLLIRIPLLILALIVGAGIAIPLVLAITRPTAFSAGAIAPICGTLVIGVPALIVAAFVLGIMQVLAQRSIMLEGRHAIDAAGASWHMFRARFKDTALMWLISWGLSIAAGIVMAIPIVILTFAVAIPAVMSGVVGNWGLAIAIGSLGFVILIGLSLFFEAVWGTFTSALWTIFFRRLVGREVVPPVEQYFGPTPPPPYAPTYPVPSPVGQPPMAASPTAGAPMTGPPMAAPPATPEPGADQAPNA